MTTEFDYTFRVFNDEHLVITVTDGNGDNERKLTLNTDYTVTGVNSNKGGRVILKSALVNGNKLLIARDLPAKQNVSFRNQGRFYAEIHENAFDYLTMLIQRVLGNLSLFLKRPSMLSNYFDAKNYRVSNISQPKSDNDAVNFGLMKSAIKDKDIRSLRVNDIDMPPFPDIAIRKNKQMGLDANGKPTLLDPSATGALGYVLVDSFEKGFEITARYQALHYEKDGGYYRWDGQLPKPVSPNSTPDSTGGINVGAWMRIVLDSYTKQEINTALNKKFDKNKVVQTTGNSTTDVISQNACTNSFAKKDSQEPFSAGRVNINRNNNYASLVLTKSDGQHLVLETSPNDAYFVYRDASGKNRGVIDIPSDKNGTLAIQEDNYTRVSHGHIKF